MTVPQHAFRLQKAGHSAACSCFSHHHVSGSRKLFCWVTERAPLPLYPRWVKSRHPQCNSQCLL